eukprot:c5995_g1_i1.p1 GENE.c5995_g1_i1~~c5995_g1_i1.p1  ORF type:complete len:173 (+),score=38.45 c5995_g1_i1:43-561(+)
MECRVVMCGRHGAGKSALVVQFVQSRFSGEYDPTIEDSYRRATTVDNKECMLDILDTSGQEEFSSMRGQWFDGGEGFVVVYSVGDRESFGKASEFRKAILKAKDNSTVPMVLVANKSDLPPSQRKVSTEEGVQMAQSFGCHYIETSAMTRSKVDDVFSTIVREVRKSQLLGK